MQRLNRAMAQLTMLVLVVLLGSLTFFGSTTKPTQAQVANTPRTVFVHLFEWKWTDIAKECENWLGPKGFAAVQVSPPQEHVQGSQWWTRYQPVSYQIQSRSGTRAEFADMVSRCKAVGVDIYVDAVINHMTGVGSGTGVAGSSYTNYNYPGIYQNQDFHHCGRNGNDDISNYQDRWEVQNCELVNLADLATESIYVRGKLAAYLNDLRSLGVAGFRIDAAKHMPVADIADIMSRASNPYIYQEVIDQGGEPITSAEYTPNGDVIEFKYSTNIGRMFKTDKLANMSNFGTAWGFLPSDSAVVFTDNHDNQRGHGGAGNVVTFKDGSLYNLANVFALAWPYGYPQVMSSYNFSNGDQGPPNSNVYNGNTTDCGGSNWVCEHRWRGIANMVGFRNYTSSAFSTSNWWSNGNNQISFSRGSLGFVAINREGNNLTRTFATGLPAGTYCDVIHGDFNNGSCSGPTVTVDGAGNATITVNSMEAVALHGGAKLGGVVPTATVVNPTATSVVPTATPVAGSIPVSFNVNATTNVGQNVYVVGNIAALGSWNTANAILLSSANYPIWSGTINLTANTAVEYKYIKKDSAGAVTWESIANRSFTTPSSGSATRNETWNVTGSNSSTATPVPTTATSLPATATPIPATATPLPATATPSGSSAVTFNVNATTVWGQNVYIVGNVAGLGSWNTANAILLSSASYPVWNGTLNLPANTAIEFKYIKKDGSGNVTWESGSNRSFTTPSSGTLTRNDNWQ